MDQVEIPAHSFVGGGSKRVIIGGSLIVVLALISWHVTRAADTGTISATVSATNLSVSVAPALLLMVRLL